MTTDRESMAREAAVDPSKGMTPPGPDQEDKPASFELMDGDIPSAYARLERIIEALESMEEPNADILKTAKSIKGHYRETKTITKPQYEWIQGVAVADPGEKVPEPHGQEAPEVNDPQADIDGKADLDSRIKQIQEANKDKAPPPPNVPAEPIIVGPKPEADVAPSGEEAVDGTPESEPVVEEQPADAPDEPVAEEESVEEVPVEETPEESSEEEKPQS